MGTITERSITAVSDRIVSDMMQIGADRGKLRTVRRLLSFEPSTMPALSMEAAL